MNFLSRINEAVTRQVKNITISAESESISPWAHGLEVSADRHSLQEHQASGKSAAFSTYEATWRVISGLHRDIASNSHQLAKRLTFLGWSQ